MSIKNVLLATGTKEGWGEGSRTIQIKIFLSFLSLCASIRNVLFTTGTIEKR